MHERDGDLLPSDVLVEILSRLPGKTLMRFKCVLKCWFSLITDPVFAELHNTRSYKREGGGIFVTPTSSTDNCLMCIIDMKKEPLDRISVLEPYIPYDNNRTSNIVNGLICFDHDTYDKCLIYLYNLTSRESISLPSTQVKNHLRPLSKRFSRTCLLGVDPINKEYKVLHFHSRRENHKMKCQVFTIGGQKKVWRPLDISHIQGYSNFTYNSCNDHLCVDGFLYWTKSDMMIRFNVVREIFNLIHFPKEKWYGLQSALVKLKVVFF